MYTTRACTFSELNPSIRSLLKNSLSEDDPIQYCIEARDDSDGEVLYLAYILTLRRIIYGSSGMGGHSGTGFIKQYIEIVNMEERPSENGKYHFVEIFFNPLGSASAYGNSNKYFFETSEKAHGFASIIKKLARL
jgi:hypothetical protein